MAKGRKNTAVQTLKEGEKPTPLTIVRAEEMAKLVSQGKSRETIIQASMEKYGIKRAQAQRIWCAAVEFLMPDDEDAYRKKLIQANFERLETIIERALETNQLKVARDAIDSMNKMLGIGHGIQVGIRNDANNNTQEFIVKLNGE